VVRGGLERGLPHVAMVRPLLAPALLLLALAQQAG
jgi:hypothetical protein